ncbi:iron-containing redox enzyme family protein [Pseudomonas promysalinigenes]|uniref:iron-containing redox enzyme family protein n=1 Tax=Pseudomonas TaxID=286 RepID=UPI001A9E5231|nr:iron-containing redox enzyme family protein [Pseudomonas sp. 51_B]
MSISQETFQSDSAYVVRSGDVSLELELFMNEQIDSILKHRATEHPFLNTYAAEGLDAEQSKVLYLETLHYFKFLPFYVCGISTLTRDEAVLRAIAFNARDELGETHSHSDLYRKFLLDKGISAEEIDGYKCLPSTQALNDGICALYTTPPLQKALGGLFADEAMSASMVSKYNDGLIKEGMSAQQRFFWTLHMEVEVGHSNAVFNIMEKHLQTPEQRALFVEGIQQYLHLMEIYWDGIARKLGKGLPA